ncbi:MAG: hypothetical protein NTZ74_06550 [Chloroflexi bacterium]|nr:hypothetical protein [Chloroflexota bacterium]
MRSELGLPLPNELMVIFGPHAGATMMLDLAARLAICGPLYILDCGNRSDMYYVARVLRPLTFDPAAMLKNIRLSRAFTCYQVFSLVERTQTQGGSPILILDLLNTFMDESVRVDESMLLFEKTLRCITSASRFAPIVVSVKPLLSISNPRLVLLTLLKKCASQVWEDLSLFPGGNAMTQLSFFDLDRR